MTWQGLFEPVAMLECCREDIVFFLFPEEGYKEGIVNMVQSVV